MNGRSEARRSLFSVYAFCPRQFSGIQPTEQEVGKAKQMLKKMDKKEKKSRYESMRTFLRLNPDEVAQASRGDQRESFLHAFLALQFRAKAGEQVIKNTHAVDKVKERKVNNYEWSQETMDKELGASLISFEPRYLQPPCLHPPRSVHRTPWKLIHKDIILIIVYIHTCMYIYTCLHAYIHTHIHTRMCIHTFTYTWHTYHTQHTCHTCHTYHTYHTCVTHHICLYMSLMPHICASLQTNMHTCIHAYLHTCIHAYIHINSHMHTYTRLYMHAGIIPCIRT